MCDDDDDDDDDDDETVLNTGITVHEIKSCAFRAILDLAGCIVA